jgi:hypothetical protein
MNPTSLTGNAGRSTVGTVHTIANREVEAFIQRQASEPILGRKSQQQQQQRHRHPWILYPTFPITEQIGAVYLGRKHRYENQIMNLHGSG